jgi:hypothetical protein
MQLFYAQSLATIKTLGIAAKGGWILLSHDRSKKQRSKLCFFFRKLKEAPSQKSLV